MDEPSGAGPCSKDVRLLCAMWLIAWRRWVSRHGDVRVTGGGARSPLWMRIKADTLGRAMRPVLGEGTATGAACLAAVTAGWYPDLFAATDELVELGEPVEATPSEAAGRCLPPLPKSLRCSGAHLLVMGPSDLPFELVDFPTCTGARLPATVAAHARPGGVSGPDRLRPRNSWPGPTISSNWCLALLPGAYRHGAWRIRGRGACR